MPHPINNNNEQDANLVACTFCGEDELWADAHHFPNATACRNAVCIAQGKAVLAQLIGEAD